MQPRAHQLCVSVCVCMCVSGDCGEGNGRRHAMRAGASWVLKANLLVSIGAVVKL